MKSLTIRNLSKTYFDVHAGAVHRDATLRGHLDRQVDREAEGVVQAERIGAANRSTAGDELLQARRARLQCARELLFLGPDGIQDRVTPVPQPRVGIAHDVDDDGARRPQERSLDDEQPSVPRHRNR